MTCEVNDIYPQFIEMYVYNQSQGCTNVIQKDERVSGGEKAFPKNQKTGEEISDGPDTSYPYFPKSKSLLLNCVDYFHKRKRDSIIIVIINTSHACMSIRSFS